MSLLKKLFGKNEKTASTQVPVVPVTEPKAEPKAEPAPQISEKLAEAVAAKPKPKKPRSDGIDWGMPNVEQAAHVEEALLKYEDAQLFTEAELKKACKLIVRAIMDGDPYKATAESLSDATKHDFDECHDLVRTVQAQAAVDADIERFRELGIKQYQIHSVLDNKTCPQCGQYDLKIFNLEDGPKPPFHKNCRCSISTVLNLPSANRAARNREGKTIQVPATMAWSEWKEIYGSDESGSKPETKK